MTVFFNTTAEFLMSLIKGSELVACIPGKLDSLPWPVHFVLNFPGRSITSPPEAMLKKTSFSMPRTGNSFWLCWRALFSGFISCYMPTA